MEERMIRFLYETAVGRGLLRLLLRAGLPRWMGICLRAPISRRLIPRYIRKHQISLQDCSAKSFPSFAAFFARERRGTAFDLAEGHFISPCDGLLSACEISADSRFFLKGSHYRLSDLLKDEALARRFLGGTCLIFRLTAADYHHYAYIDSGYVHTPHYIEGELHSVQPIACEALPVFRLNRRCWTLLDTEAFGPVVQIEIGALAVGEIVNLAQNTAVHKGEEKGYFELCGSTIVLLLEKDRVRLLPEIASALRSGREYRVRQGHWIGERCK